MKKFSIICFLVLLFLPIKTIFTQSLDDSLRRLEEALSGRATASASVQQVRGGTQPQWVNEPYTSFPRASYIAAVGESTNRGEAEKRAFGALASIFGQTVRSDFTVATVYSEAVSKGMITVSDNTNIRDMIVTAASLDTLIGAEIGNVWDDGRGMVYALAYIEREKARNVYTDMLRINERNIENLTAMGVGEKNTFSGYTRYKLAASIAELNEQYARVVSQIGGSSALNLSNADSLNLEALKIKNSITVSLSVDGDRDNKIQQSFTRIVNSEGLRIQNSNTPYTLEIVLSLIEVKLPNNGNTFCQYTVNAKFLENATGSLLLSFIDTGREPHLTYAGAETRAITRAERVINEQYPALLREFLKNAWSNY